jgi:hypothetical protein
MEGVENLEEFYQKLISHQNNSQRWNAIVCDIVEVYSYKFPEQELFRPMVISNRHL